MRSIAFFILLFVLGCSQPNSLSDVKLKTIDGTSIKIDPASSPITVVYFLSPECPLCINYTLALREISAQFKSDSIAFFGVHSGEWFSAREVEDYALKYNLDITMIIDEGNQLAKTLGATITPEVFVLNSSSEILYSGKIDNWVNDLGKKKLEVSERYLFNALVALKKGQPISPKKTEPIGCLIE